MSNHSDHSDHSDHNNIENRIRTEMRQLFHRHDVVSLSLKGNYPDYYIDVGLVKSDINFPKWLKIDCLGGKEIQIKTKTMGRIVSY